MLILLTSSFLIARRLIANVAVFRERNRGCRRNRMSVEQKVHSQRHDGRNRMLEQLREEMTSTIRDETGHRTKRARKVIVGHIQTHDAQRYLKGSACIYGAFNSGPERHAACQAWPHLGSIRGLAVSRNELSGTAGGNNRRDERDGVRSIFSISWGMKLLLFLGSGALSGWRCYSMPGSVAHSLKSTTLLSPLISLAHFAAVKIQFIVERWTERVFRKRRRCRWCARARITNDALRVDTESSYPEKSSDRESLPSIGGIRFCSI